MKVSFHAPAIEYSEVQGERMSFPLIVALCKMQMRADKLLSSDSSAFSQASLWSGRAAICFCEVSVLEA